MATITAAAGGGVWSAGGSWVGGVPPGAGDDALLTATSGAITVDSTNGAARSLNCTGYTSTLTINSASTLTLGTSTTVAGSAVLTLVAGMTLTLGSASTSGIVFASTSGTQEQITSASKTLGNVTFNGAGGSWILQDGFSTGTTATVTLTAGTLNTNNQTCSWGSFNANSSSLARTLTPGSSAITITGTGVAWNQGNSPGWTCTTNTSVVTMTGASATWKGINCAW